MFGQGVQSKLLPEILEEVLLSPAFDHAVSDEDGGQVSSGGEDGRAMAVVHQAGDLAQAQFALEQAHLLIGQIIGGFPAFDDRLTAAEGFAGDPRGAPRAVVSRSKPAARICRKSLGLQTGCGRESLPPGNVAG